MFAWWCKIVRQFSNHKSRLTSWSSSKWHHFCLYVWLYPSIKSHMQIHICMWIVTIKLQSKGQWPLDDLWLYIPWGHLCNSAVSSSHGNTSRCVDAVIFVWNKKRKWVMTLDDLWPHFCWGHMCDSNHVSVSQVPCKYINVDTATNKL